MKLPTLPRRWACLFYSFHDPVVLPGMEVILPEETYTAASGFEIRRLGRRMLVGDTTCSRCGKVLHLDGSVTSYMKRGLVA